jgi:16S rRNA (guanine527-N7)-methyltransferase
MTDCGLEVNDLQVNLFWQYYLRLRERNRDINLTRIHRFEDVVVKHFVDCGMVGLLTALPSPLMDIGSGGGFPGVPLKILHPDVEIVLAEGRRLRVEFLEEVRRSLRLPKLHIHGHQIHPGNTDPQMQSVVTRAVERIGKTLQRVEGHCPVGSRAIFMKGPSVDPEIEEVKDGAPGARWRLAEDHHYLLPSTDHKRRLVVYERIAR